MSLVTVAFSFSVMINIFRKKARKHLTGNIKILQNLFSRDNKAEFKKQIIFSHLEYHLQQASAIYFITNK